MELFKRNPFVRTTKEEVSLEPVPAFTPVEAADSQAPARNWQMLAALAVAALAFAILIGVGGSWVYHKLHNNQPSNSASSLPKPPPQNL